MLITNKKIPLFNTPDLGLASALSIKNYKLLKLDKSNARKSIFIFAYSESLDKTVADYFSGNLLVDAQSYFNQIKSLKNYIYSA